MVLNDRNAQFGLLWADERFAQQFYWLLRDSHAFRSARLTELSVCALMLMVTLTGKCRSAEMCPRNCSHWKIWSLNFWIERDVNHETVSLKAQRNCLQREFLCRSAVIVRWFVELGESLLCSLPLLSQHVTESTLTQVTLNAEHHHVKNLAACSLSLTITPISNLSPQQQKWYDTAEKRLKGMKTIKTRSEKC